MQRQKRHDMPGCLYKITQKISEDAFLFYANEDKKALKEIMRESEMLLQVDIQKIIINQPYYSLYIKTHPDLGEGQVMRFVKKIHSVYVRYMKRKYHHLENKKFFTQRYSSEYLG